MIRSGYSFKRAYGHLEDVLSRIQECKLPAAPLADTSATFGFTRWTKLCKKAGIKPVYGVELAVTPNYGDKKPVVDYWTFIAKNSLVPLHKLIEIATDNPGKEPILNYQEALAAEGVYKIAGHAARLDHMENQDNLFIGMSPAMNRGFFKHASEAGYSFIARSDNFYPRAEDKEAYRIALGRRSNTQTYSQWILTDDEWHDALDWVPQDERQDAIDWRNELLGEVSAELIKGENLKPERKESLREICCAGAARLGCNLSDPVYAARLERELKLIEDKGFDDYIYIIADMVNWAKQRMIVGPARGSSCGSLVCYLTGITTVDPIPYNLLFERFIDINRNDPPDIDIDFSDSRRDMVFEYAEKKYGRDHVARLGTVHFFRTKSALNAIGPALGIPQWELDKVADAAPIRSEGDSGYEDTLKDAFETTEAGQKLIKNFPEAVIASKLEGHPTNHSQHAAGVIITAKPIIEYIGINAKSPRSVMCDKKDAEEQNLLKIDALGLTQLSIFERCLQLIGQKDRSGWLETLPLDCPEAFDVLNSGRFSGIFQFDGAALKGLTKQVKVSHLEDLVSLTSLARPGPLDSGGAEAWVKRKNGEQEVSYYHPAFEPILKDTLGIIISQEQVMRIGREVGDMAWPDVIALRKAIGKKLGGEVLNSFKEKFAVGAKEKGIPDYIIDAVWQDVCTFGSYGFNRCIAGSTKIKLAQKSHLRPNEMTMSEFFHFHKTRDNKYLRSNWNGGWRPSLISMFPDMRGRPQKITDVFYSGIKRCWKYSFDDGSEVVCTKEHRFLIDGEWRSIGSAVVGNTFMSMEYEPSYEPSGRGKGHAAGREYDGHGFPSGKENPSWVNGWTAKKKDFIASHSGMVCEDCSELSDRMEAHHNDFNSGYDRPDDLAWLCASCHKTRHYKKGRTKVWEKGYQPTSKRLVSIEDAGEQETFDIEMPVHHNFMLANGLVTHNSHAVAYSIVSYYCMWLKAHYPVEFGAATLDAEKDPQKQIKILRELKAEGVDYIPVDPEASGTRWEIKEEDGRKVLVGPLTQIKGIGPAKVQEIINSRATGKELGKALKLMLEKAKTEIDSLYPIETTINRLHPDLEASAGIVTSPTKISDVKPGETKGNVVIIGVVKRINQKNENAPEAVKRRGYEMKGPTTALNLFVADDHDEIFVKIDRFKFEEKGRPILDRGRAGAALYAFKGYCPPGFRMISVIHAKYLGDMEDDNDNANTN